MSKWPVEYVKKDQSMLDTTLENRQRLRFLKESSINLQDWLHWDHHSTASQTSSMSKWPVEHVNKVLDTTLKYRQWFSSLKQSSTHSQNWVHSEQNIIHHILARCPKWPVEHVKKDQSILDTTPHYPQWLSFLKESSINAQNWGLCEQNINASHTCSM